MTPQLKRLFWGSLTTSLMMSSTLAHAAAGDLELKRVMLSSGGVGYFEYEADVSGSAQLDFNVKLDQVNDVLKSLVVYDDEGQVGEITLPGQEPLKEVFREMPFEQGDLASPATMFNALRGAEVTVTGAKRLSGRILSVTQQKTQLPNGLGTVSVHRVSVMTGTGIQQFILEDADEVKFVDQKLQEQVGKALKALALNKEQDRRTVSVNLVGGGDRTVRVGYVIEAPLWKSAYRLTVDADPKDKNGQLQGWAVLENLSGEDWKDIDLTIVSGNPVTFTQALYDAYYVDRPELPVEVFGRVMPRTDKGAIEHYGAAGEMELAAAPSPMMKQNIARFEEKAHFESDMAMADQAFSAPVAARAPQNVAKLKAAETSEAATQVVFTMPEKVSVASGESVMVPLVSKDIPIERVSLYQPDTHPTHPLATVKLVNDGKVGLPPGIITLYEANKKIGMTNFVGDAQLNALPAGENRMISFAVDQKVKVDVEQKYNDQLTSAKIVDGVLIAERKNQQRYIYTIDGAATEDRDLMIEIPRRHGWDIVTKDQAKVDLTDDYWRVAGNVKAGKTVQLPIIIEQTVEQRLALSNISTHQIALYLKAPVLDKKVRRALDQVMLLSQSVSDYKNKVRELDQEKAQIYKEQAHLRDNLRVTERNSDLYKRYIRKMNTTEDKLESLSEQQEQANKLRQAAEEKLRKYVRNLSIG